MPVPQLLKSKVAVALVGFCGVTQDGSCVHTYVEPAFAPEIEMVEVAEGELAHNKRFDALMIGGA